MSISEFRKITEYSCKNCGINEWLGSKITLEIDHIDGINTNDELNNLRYLCPNCHSQTYTWRGRNKNTGKLKVTDEQLLIAISETENIRQALLKVGLAPKSLNYNRVSNLLQEEKQISFKNSQYGTIWINDGKINKKIKKELLSDYESVGYKRGRIATYRIPNQKGRFWITNGLVNKLIDKESLIPEGFWRGKKQK